MGGAMGQKETNIARTFGVIPYEAAAPIPVGKIPDGAAQIVRGLYANNNTVVLRTVGALVTLYLSVAALSVRNISGASGYATFFVTNNNDTAQYYFGSLVALDDHGPSLSLSFCPPLEIPGGWKVKVDSNVDGLGAFGFIHGYEI